MSKFRADTVLLIDKIQESMLGGPEFNSQCYLFWNYVLSFKLVGQTNSSETCLQIPLEQVTQATGLTAIQIEEVLETLEMAGKLKIAKLA